MTRPLFNVRPYGVSIVLRLPQHQLSVPIRIHGQGVPCKIPPIAGRENFNQ